MHTKVHELPKFRSWNKKRSSKNFLWASQHESLSNLRAPSTTAIFNRNRDFQRQPRPNFPCMGSGNRNHHHDLQIAVAVAVDQNFLIFGGRSLKSRLRLLWCMGRSDQILSVVTLKQCYIRQVIRVEVRHCWELRFNWERLNRSVAACVGRPSTAIATAIWLHIAVAIEDRCRGWGPLGYVLKNDENKNSGFT